MVPMNAEALPVVEVDADKASDPLSSDVFAKSARRFLSACADPVIQDEG